MIGIDTTKRLYLIALFYVVLPSFGQKSTTVRMVHSTFNPFETANRLKASFASSVFSALVDYGNT